MYKYAVVDYRNIVIDLITVSSKDIIDEYTLPEGPCICVFLNNRTDWPLIGQSYDSGLDKFQ